MRRFSLYETAVGAGENSVNFPGREVLIPKEMLGRNEWELGHVGNQKLAIVHVSLAMVLMRGRCVVLTAFINM